MKKRIKFLSLIMALCMTVAAFTACGSSKEDWEYIEEQGKLVIGYTLFKPMNYQENGELIGFDTEFAQAVTEELGVTPEFIEINWDTKITELKSKKIDVIWNGFTMTEKLAEEVDFTMPYLVNKQVAVVQKSKLDQYKTIEDLAKGKITAEAKSAGEKAVQSEEKLKDAEYNSVGLQTDVLMEVKSGTSDVGVIDYTMAKAMLQNETDYSDLAIVEGVELAPEEYGIGFRKNSPKTLKKVNQAIEKLAKSGKLAEIAEKYGLTEQLADNLQ